MNQIQNYRFNYELGENGVRVVMVEGDPWWIAKDVCESLGYTWNGICRIEHVPEQWRGVTSVVTPSGNQDMHILSEAGLFFFLNRSDKPKALPFQMWIAGEVLPQIRRTGQYSLPLTTAPDNFVTGTVETIPEISEKLSALETTLSDIKEEIANIAFIKQSIEQLHQEYENKPYSKKHGICRVKCSFQDIYRTEWLTGMWISTLGASISEKEVITLAIDALIEKLKLELKGEKPTFALRRTSIPVNPHRIPYDQK